MRSKSSLGIAVAAAVTFGFALLYPLYGDPRVSAVSHPEWARMMLRGLDLESPGMDTASVAFGALAWHSSLAFKGSEFEKADAVRVLGDPPNAVAAEAGVGQASYPLTVARPGEYQIRAHLSGLADKPASVEVMDRKGDKPLATFTLRPAAQAAWVDGGRVQLAGGAYLASVLLPPGTSLDRFEVVPPCVTNIEPLGGWQTAKVATTDDVAVTTLRALDKESELAPAGVPFDLPGSAIARYLPALRQAAATDNFDSGPQGAEGLLTFQVPEAGLYTVSVKGNLNGGQQWTADGCKKQVVCTGSRRGTAAGEWTPVLSSDFTAGPHAVAVRLGPNSTVEAVRVQRKQAGADAYVAALKGLGLELGPDGPVTRSKMVDAVDFLRKENRASMGASCAGVAPPQPNPPSGQRVTHIAVPGQSAPTAGEPPTVPGVSPFVPIPEVPSPVQASAPSSQE
jgi:hypothetical protein